MPPRGPMHVEKAKDAKSSIKKLIHYLRPYLAFIILAVILSMSSTVIGIFGPSIQGQATTLLYEGITSKISGGSGIDFDSIGRICLIMLGLYVFSALVSYFANFIVSTLSAKITYQLRKDVSEKIDRLPLSYFDTKTHGEVLSRVTNDVDSIASNLSNTIQQVLSSVVLVVGVLIMMIRISWKLTLFAMIVVPLSGIAAARIIKISQKYYRQHQAYLGEIDGHIEELYAGHTIVKAYNYEDKAINDFDEINDKLQKAGAKSQFLSTVMFPVSGFFGNVGYVLVCLAGGFEAINGRITIGNIQALNSYVRNFNQQITSVSQLMNIIQAMAAAAERVFELLEEKEEVEDTADPVNIYDEKGEIVIQGNVSFENVRFGYDADKIVISDFSMYIKPGQNVAIVGPTGAGKTTLVKLLMRFYELNGGCIYVDGHDIRDYKRSDLRNLFGMVLQDTWLYSGSIKDNIKYGKADASDEEVVKACELAKVDHFIRTLENGYDTLMDEESGGVSQGQKQLITIARAFLKDPKILILDEATSSVDTRTEQLIQDGMERLMKGRTSFVIAHRLSTIRNADIIIVLDKGDIVEVGNHQDLLAKDGFYAKLYNSQFEM